MNPMIEFKNVSYVYANAAEKAVTGISLTVNAGELKVVTGASGCGKTTLMRLANGLCPQIYGGGVIGEVLVAGLNVSETPVAQLAEHVGTLFQDPEEQFFALCVGDEIAFALRSRGVAPEAVEERVLAAAARLGITELLGQDIHSLSEGQKQKVGLASILALGPKVLIFDEPSANLDPEATESLAVTMGELKREGAAILVVDHRLYWLRDVADEVIVMSRGRIECRGGWEMLRDESLRAKWGLRRADVDDPRVRLEDVPIHFHEIERNDAAIFSTSRMSFGYSPERPVFTDVSFAVPAGITALIGSNGTGKTTLARILTGLNKAAGDFAVCGAPVGEGGLMPHSGLVLQNADHQLQMRTVREEILSAMTAGLSARRAKAGFWRRFSRVRLTESEVARYEEILRDLNLTHVAERHPQSLSGGEKQRVVIACALVKNPAILILDEPTSGLDGANMACIARLLRIEADKGRAVFLITHDLELLDICDRALRMTRMQPQAEA